MVVVTVYPLQFSSIYMKEEDDDDSGVCICICLHMPVLVCHVFGMPMMMTITLLSMPCLQLLKEKSQPLSSLSLLKNISQEKAS